MTREPLDLLQGTLDVLILRTLTWEPMHGYAVSRWIRERTGQTIQIEDAPLYKALHRLEKQKWIKADWRISENKQRAKFYRLTATGKKQLTKERSKWAQLSDAIAGVLN